MTDLGLESFCQLVVHTFELPELPAIRLCRFALTLNGKGEDLNLGDCKVASHCHREIKTLKILYLIRIRKTLFISKGQLRVKSIHQTYI